MGVLDNASIGGSSGRKNKIILPNPEPTPQPFTGGGSSSSSTSWEDRQPPERFNVNLMEPAQPQVGIAGYDISKAPAIPQTIAAKPFDIAETITKDSSGTGIVKSAMDVIAQVPVLNKVLGFTGDLLTWSAQTALYNSGRASTIQANANDILQGNWNKEILSEANTATLRNQYGVKKTKTLGEYWKEMKEIGFTQEDVIALSKNQKGIFDFGNTDPAKGQTYIMEKEALVGIPLGIALDPLTYLSFGGVPLLKGLFQGATKLLHATQANAIFNQAAKVAPILRQAAPSAHAVANSFKAGTLTGTNVANMTKQGYLTIAREAVTGTRVAGPVRQALAATAKSSGKGYLNALRGNVTYAGYKPNLFQKYLISSTALTVGQAGLTGVTELVSQGDNDNIFVGGLRQFLTDLEGTTPVTDRAGFAVAAAAMWNYPLKAISSSTMGATVGTFGRVINRGYGIDAAIAKRLTENLPKNTTSAQRISYLIKQWDAMGIKGQEAWDGFKGQLYNSLAVRGSDLYGIPQMAPRLIDDLSLNRENMAAHAIQSEEMARAASSRFSQLLDDGKVRPEAVVEQIDSYIGNIRGVEDITGGIKAKVDSEFLVKNWGEYWPTATQLWGIADNYGQVVLKNFEGRLAQEQLLVIRQQFLEAAKDGIVPAKTVREIIIDRSALLSTELSDDAPTGRLVAEEWKRILVSEKPQSFKDLDALLQKDLVDAPTLDGLTQAWGVREAAAPIEDLSVPRGPLKLGGATDFDWSPDASSIYVSRFRESVANRVGLSSDTVDVAGALSARADDQLSTFEGKIGAHLTKHGYVATTAKPVIGVFEASVEPSMHLVMPKSTSALGVLKNAREAAVLSLRGGTKLLSEQQDAVLLLVPDALRRQLNLKPNSFRVRVGLRRGLSIEETQSIVTELSKVVKKTGATIDQEAGTIELVLRNVEGAVKWTPSSSKATFGKIVEAINKVAGEVAPDKRVESVYSELIKNDAKGDAVNYLGKTEVTVREIERAAIEGINTGDTRFVRALADSASLRPSGLVADGTRISGEAGSVRSPNFGGVRDNADRAFSSESFSDITSRLSKLDLADPEYQVLKDEALDQLSLATSAVDKARVLGALGAEIAQLDKSADALRVVQNAEELISNVEPRIASWAKSNAETFNLPPDEARAVAEMVDKAMAAFARAEKITVEEAYDDIVYQMIRGGEATSESALFHAANKLDEAFAASKSAESVAQAIEKAKAFRPTEDMVALGRKLNDPNISGYHEVEVLPSSMFAQVDGVPARDIALPGGLKFLDDPAPYSLSDTLVIRSQAIDPNIFPTDMYVKLHKKIASGISADLTDPVDVFNRMQFAQQSANGTVLAVNEAQYIAFRASGMAGVEELAEIAAKSGSKNSSEVGKALARNLELYLPESKFKGIDWDSIAGGAKKRKEALENIEKDGYFSNPDYKFGTIGWTDRAGKMALNAQFLTDNPSFFTVRAGETLADLADRIALLKGFQSKLSNFSVQMLNPKLQTRGTIDLQMSRSIFDDARAMGGEYLDGLLSRLEAAGSEGKAYANSMRKYLDGDITASTEAPARKILAKDKYENQLSPSLQSALAEIPSHLRSKEILSYRGSAAEVMDEYLEAMRKRSAAQNPAFDNMSLGEYQWYRWDLQRGKIEPHSLMRTGANKLPKAPLKETAASLDVLRRAGFTERRALSAFDPESISTYFMSRGGKKLGSTEFLENGKALIRGFEGSSWRTATHEWAHVFRLRMIKGEDLATASKWAGATLDDSGNWVWTKAQEEKFADTFNEWLGKGKAPVASLDAVFEKFRKWLVAMYDRVAKPGSKVKISKDIEMVFEGIFRNGDEAIIEPRTKGERSLLDILTHLENDLKGGNGNVQIALESIARDFDVENRFPFPKWHASMKGVDLDVRMQLAPFGADVIKGGKYKLSEAPNFSIPTRPDQTFLGQATTLQRSLFSELLEKNPIVSAPMRFIDRVTRPVSSGVQTSMSRQFLYRELLGRGATVSEVDQFLALLKGLVDTDTFMSFNIYRGVGSLFKEKIDSAALGVWIGTPAKPHKVVLATKGRFGDILDQSQSRYYRWLDQQAGINGGKGFIAKNLKIAYEKYQPTTLANASRAVGRFMYPLFRFIADPRWYAMNKMEADIINGTKYGLQATRFKNRDLPGTLRAKPGQEEIDLMDAAYATHFQRGLPTMGKDIRGIPTTIMAGLDSGYSDMRRITGYANSAFQVARQRNTNTALREFGINPSTLEFESVESALNFIGKNDPYIRTLSRVTPEAMLERAQSVQSTLKAWSKRNDGKEVADILNDELYTFEKLGHRGGMEKIADEIIGQERKNMSPLLQRLFDINEASMSTHLKMLRGNVNRSDLERLLNSYWLYWPISYQIKATRWMFNVLTDASGTGTLRNVVKVERLHQLHVMQMRDNPEYAAIFENNPALWMTAQMLMPIYPGDMGVSLSKIPRYVGGALGVFPEYSVGNDALQMAKRAMEIGPLFTLSLLQDIGKEGTLDILPFVGD
jgi:hypothetical protein